MAALVVTIGVVTATHVGTAAASIERPDIQVSSTDGGQAALFSCMDMGAYYKCITHAGDVFYIVK